MDVATREVRNLTGGPSLPRPRTNWTTIPTSPAPTAPPGGWRMTQAFLVYDAFDIWAVDPAGRQAPRNLTEGVGRDQRHPLPVCESAGRWRRRWRRRRRRRRRRASIPPRTPSSRPSTSTPRQDGFYRDRFDGTREPQRLIMDDYGFGNPTEGRGRRRLRPHPVHLPGIPGSLAHRSRLPATWRRSPTPIPSRTSTAGGHGRARGLDLQRRHPPSGHPHQARRLRPVEEVPHDGLLLRAELRRPAPLPSPDAGGSSVNYSVLREPGLRLLRPGHPLRDRPPR